MSPDAQSSNQPSKKDVSIGAYLLGRLKQLGVKHVFGQPGDFNMGFLDLIEDDEGIEWIGCCNEMNAGYAADGVNRVGVLVTTFGVGELSAMNAVAGAFSEMVPVVHIVGTPSTESQSQGALLHHTLGNGDFKIYHKMYENITVAQTVLSHHNAKDEIDRVLRECYIHSRPVYISIPTDICVKKIAADLSQPLVLTIPENVHEVEYAAINRVIGRIHKSANTIVLIDACASRHDISKELLDFINKTGFPFFTSPMGKSIIPENHPLFGGIYIGSVSEPHVKREVEEADLIISIGAIRSDFNTGGFTYHVSQAKTIELCYNRIKVFFATYEGVSMKHALPKITACIERMPSSTISPPYQHNLLEDDVKDQRITQNWFWHEVSSTLLQENDIIIGEMGTSVFGLMDIRFPPGSTFIGQILYGSIGYSVGACLGASLAATNVKERRRVCLFVGDGSFQVTAQEISTIIRHNLNPVIFLINNNGFTIERMLHGIKRKYNDIAQWKFDQTLEYFGGSNEVGRTVKLATKSDFKSFVSSILPATPSRIQFVEVMMDKYDAPRALIGTASFTAEEHMKEKVLPMLHEKLHKKEVSGEQ
ncbi:1776_t:CDS:2 [Acaulospora colombiana]|uniref:1776_t:CDS:1 n=1 Tax=Acaulospora colombiana TaxID=27376 RepID=A0ACA9JUT3_9GLOM|nr:1776_t:CDS:2 [Acaulospora colombiana]